MSRFYTTKTDLESLIENSAIENLQLEFKRFKAVDGKLEQKDKDTLGKEIIAMANAEGGSIIIGIDEDGKRCAAKLTDTGLTAAELDGFQLSIQQYLLAKVRPRLYGITYTGVPIKDDKIAVVISVPKSYSRPHALNDGNKDVFYIRHSNGVTNMSVDDLRKQFLALASIKGDIQDFRRDRIGMIMTNEGSIDLKDGAKLLVHIIPLWSLEPGNNVDLNQVNNDDSSVGEPLFSSTYSKRYNSDGFITFSEDSALGAKNRKCTSYVQFFRSGMIEALDARVLNYEEKRMWEWAKIERGIFSKLKECLALLDELKVPTPIYIYVSLLGAKGFHAMRSNNMGYFTNAVDRDIVTAIECIWAGEGRFDDAIRLTFDSLVNSFGIEYSHNYNEDGSYVVD